MAFIFKFNVKSAIIDQFKIPEKLLTCKAES
jgi:hypothetical protein